MRFLKKIQEKVARFEEVERLLHDPSVTSDPNRVKDLGKEFRGLEKIKNLYGEYLKVREEGEEVRHLLNDKSQSADLLSMATHEAEALSAREKKAIQDLESILMQEDPLLAKNVIMEIRAGTGGLEAGLFAGDLLRMYSRFAAKCGFKIEVLSSSPNDAGGL